jgi:cytochrome P450
MIAADGESHKRQKKAISPGFTSVKIREYTSLFYDCAHRVEYSQLFISMLPDE